ncbi:GNAT family N-acetyltransferase [Virgibacillus kekensis]|uniref:GNAT family N-acetyltransferase n=1 Tax=Virgibacillus kekensis TaxID=202261 RepID=A0ABV9DK27_9BACI
MEIRLLEPEDAEVYRTLRLEALLNSPEAFVISYEEELSNSVDIFKVRFQADNAFTFGAFEGDNLIGVVTLTRETKKKMDHRTTVFALYVTPYKRSRGIGKQLMIHAVDFAKTLEGVEQVGISVVTRNDTAKSLYYALGYVPYGTRKRAVKLGDNYFDEEHMVMYLK